MNVAVIQPVVPSYRISFFNALHQRPEFHLEVFAGMSAPGCPITPCDSFDFTFNLAPLCSIWRNRIFWQYDVRVPHNFGAGDVLVLCGNPRYLSNYPLMFSARLKKVGIVWWGHGHTPGPKRWSENVRKWIMRLADAILLYTDKEIDDFCKAGFSRENLFATNNTIDISDIDRAKQFWNPTRLALFKKEHKLDSAKVLLFSGRLLPKAELKLAIDALSTLLRKDPSYRLIIIGDGEEKQKVMSKAMAAGVCEAVYWCGALYNQTDVAPWFLSALAFVYPGDIGLSLMHAFAYNLPVVTHDFAQNQNPECAALRPGRNGLLFKHGDAVDLGRKIQILADDPIARHHMSANALNTVRNEYSFANMADRFVKAVLYASARVA